MQPAKAAHGAFLARQKLTASGSSRAPCAFPNLRCYPRCWLFSCLGFEFPTPLFPLKSTKRSAAAISRSQRSFITFHGALRNILLSAGFPAMFHMIALEQTFVNGSLQKFFLLLLPFQIESIRSVIYISLLAYRAIPPLCQLTSTANAAESCSRRKPPSVMPRTITKIGIWNKKCERGI